MNYIELINRFWTMNEEHCFNSNEIATYFYLLKVNNSCSWKQSFNHNNHKIMLTLNINSFNTYNAIRNKLKQAGLIDFKTKNGSAITNFTLSKNDMVNNEVSDKVANEVTDEVSSSIDKLKETKLNKSSFKKEAKANQRFSPPSLLDIEKEILLKNFKTVNANSFFNFYESKNWMVGKNKMKSWPMALAGWESRNKESNGKKYNNSGGTNSNQGYKPASVDTEKIIRELTDDSQNGNVPGQY